MADPTTLHQSRFKRYLAGVGTSYVRMFAQVAVALWLVPFTLRYLDREQYAIFSLVNDALVWLGLLDLGISAGLRAQAARLVGQSDTERMNRLASTAFFAQIGIVLAVMVLGTGMAVGFPHFFPIRPDLHQEAIMVCLILVFSVGLSTGTATFSGLLIAHQQLHIDNLIGLLLIAIRTVVTVVLLKSGWGLYSLAVAHVAAKLVTGVLAVLRTYRLLPDLHLHYGYVNWESLRGTFHLGIWFTVGSVASVITDWLDSTVVAKVISVETVTTLSLTRRLYDLSGALVVVLTDSARPMLGQMLGQNEHEQAFGTYRMLFSIASSLAVVAAMVVWSGNQCFVREWAGAINYAGGDVDLVLGFCMVLYNWMLPNQSILAANLALRSQCLVRLGEAALNLTLAVWLGRKFGLLGVPLGAVIATMVTSFWLMPWLTTRMFKRSLASFFREDAAPVLLLLLILLPVALGARTLAEHVSGYLGALAGASLTGVCGLGLIWLLVLDQTMKQKILQLNKWGMRILPAPVRTSTGT